ncbi:hypothetical protein PHLCEN_2v9399 [Hermanssonia centrifuga]|uniref:Uncharacterized protein n=1 Tax=Hermanssonia centrifuga TaxID=98765 RepID=A0A2R6NRM6_9APHY|nr:hypothetical protein PHLCEN_2v9399 [Hermanssonia centrifuga]
MSHIGLSVALEREGWEVHQEVEDPAHYGVPPLEEFEGTEDEKDQEILRQLKSHDSQTADTKRALILKISHIGGHKYAGNLIVGKEGFRLKYCELAGCIARLYCAPNPPFSPNR